MAHGCHSPASTSCSATCGPASRSREPTASSSTASRRQAEHPPRWGERSPSPPNPLSQGGRGGTRAFPAPPLPSVGEGVSALRGPTSEDDRVFVLAQWNL